MKVASRDDAIEWGCDGQIGFCLANAAHDILGGGNVLLRCGAWNARHFLYQLRSGKTGTRGALDGTRKEAYSGANREPATAG